MTDQEKIELYKINSKLEKIFQVMDKGEYSNNTLKYNLWELLKLKRELELKHLKK